MFKAERLKRIKEIIFERKQVNVTTLSTLLDVTEVTIRSDLEILEEEGFIVRTHGGAVLNEEYTNQQAVNDALSGRNINYDKDKEYIGKIASSLIEENEWVFLGPGVTCYYIAKALLSRKNVNILSNNLFVVNILSSNPYINVISTGGVLTHSQSYMTGDLFAKSIENMYFSKAFFSVSGVDLSGGYTLSNSVEMETYREVVKRTKEPIFVIDHTKFNRLSFLRIGDLEIVKTVISNEKIPKEYKAYFFEHGIRIFTSYELDS
jgi:DeoR/GlpR family transcriptional regulator of sugar metabolism